MKILILATDPNLYSHKRIIEEAKKRGHIVDFANVKECYMQVTALKPDVHYNGKILKGYDVVIPRLRPSLTEYGTTVLGQFEAQDDHPFILNKARAIELSRDKYRSLQAAAKAGLGIPKTGFASSPGNTKDLISMVGGAPLVVKLLEGTQGVGVVLAETRKAAESLINAFKSLKANILVQEFIKESSGRDLRCFVVGDKVVAAMERRAAEGEFKANVHLGATVHEEKISPEEREMAVKAAKTMGLKVAGVDIIRSKDGPKLLEVNSSPGLEGIEGATGKNIAGIIIDYAEKMVEKLREKKKSLTSNTGHPTQENHAD